MPSTVATCPTSWASSHTRASTWPSTRSVALPSLGSALPGGLNQLTSIATGGEAKHHGPWDPGEPFQALHPHPCHSSTSYKNLPSVVWSSQVSGHVKVGDHSSSENQGSRQRRTSKMPISSQNVGQTFLYLQANVFFKACPFRCPSSL